MNLRIDRKTLRGRSVAGCLSVTEGFLDLSLVQVRDLVMKAGHRLVLNARVRADGQAEVLGRAIDDGLEARLNIIVELIHAHIDVTQLRVLHGDPLLNLLAILIDTRDLSDVIELGYGLFRLLTRLQLLVLLNDGIASLQRRLVLFDVVLGEREPANHVENWAQ